MLKRAGFAPSPQFEYARLLILRPLIRCLPSSALALRPRMPRSFMAQNTSVRPNGAHAPQMQNAAVPHPPSAPAQLLCSLLSKSLTPRVLVKRIRQSSLLPHLLDPTKARLLAEAIAATPGTSHHAVPTLRLAHLLGCKMKQNAYECTAHQLAHVSKWDHILAVVSVGKRHTGKTTVRLLNWRVRALVETDQYLQLHSILEEFSLYHVKPNRRTFHLLISGCMRNRDLASTQDLLRIMEEHNIPPDESTTATIAIYHRNFGTNSQVQERGMKILPTLGGITATAVLNSLVELRLGARDLTGCLDLLMLFDSKQIISIVQVVSGLVSTQDHEGRYIPSSPSCSLSISPNAETFAIFIRYFASQANLVAALHVLEGLLTTSIQPTAEIVASLVHTLFQSKQSTVAIRMVVKMCDPQTRLPETLLPPESDMTDVKLPLDVSGIKPTTRVFNALLKGILPIHGLDVFHDVISVMQANGLQPNASTVEVLIAYLRGASRIRPGTLGRLIRRMYFSPTVRPSIRHLHTLLSVILRHERFLKFGSGWDSFAAKFSRSRQAQVRVVSDSQTSQDRIESIGGLSLRKVDNRITRSIVEDLKSRGVNVDAPLTSLRLRQEAGIKLDLDGAQAVFEAILARGMQVNKYHCGALMEGYVQAGDLRSASDVLKRAIQIGIEPNVVLFTILIVGHARQGNPEDAVRVFQQMVANRIQPDIAAIDAVSSAFFAVGSYGMARNTLMSLWPYIAPFPEDFRTLRLRQLAVEFRSIQPRPKELSKQEWIALYRKLTHLILRWRASLELGKNKK
ncbi:hypothetical protein K435DRAFT_746110 [Dendrothele bispora CBS 962.96]|uniref:Pentacotripeptide-repeat region of PRORP domain-containing protein n=1 Tax=Dendrothele bispora (strain CBS 962.96) TaxID=1314807 RepID=A0A4S8MR67_DENBC|nr:hypothetical protein K435DRAFT_746110 [Dendrothele bispora CBS 962.96]